MNHRENEEKYILNKNMYNSIRLISQSGGGDSGWKFFTNNEKKSIQKDFDDITKSGKKCESHSLKKVVNATKGMRTKAQNKTKSVLCDDIRETIQNNQDPIQIKEDSLTAWANQAVERFGLTIGDILKMKFGDTMRVILMDRNSGEGIPNTIKVGSRFDPCEHGFSYATYIHGEGLTGLLQFDDIAVIHAPFTWELNIAALGSQWFWGPIDYNECCNPFKKKKKNEKKNEQTDIYKLDKRILVGWRGPAVRMDDVKKHMPRKVTRYDMYESPSFRYTNYLTKK
jgi:hypothetical protein